MFKSFNIKKFTTLSLLSLLALSVIPNGPKVPPVEETVTIEIEMNQNIKNDIVKYS